MFRRLVDFSDGRPIAVSLSAGPDSRLIALKLAELDYPDLYSFAYTRKGEEDVAEDVADSLGMDFERIPVSHQEIYDWYHSDERRRFDRQSGVLATVPNHWVAFAIKKLKQNSSIPSDAIIVTGDGAQTMASHIPNGFIGADQIPKSQFIDKIIDNNHFRFEVDPQVDALLRERVLDRLNLDLYEDTDVKSADRAISAFEEWDWQERQCKSIRSNYMYEYFDFQFWFPFKDHEYMDFWRDMPLKYRQGKTLHDEYVQRRYREDTGELMVESSFMTKPKWLWLLNNTVGKLPVAGPFARRLYRQLFKSDFDYDPQFGMLSEDQLKKVINEFIANNENTRKLTARHIHALNITDEYQIDSEDIV